MAENNQLPPQVPPGASVSSTLTSGIVPPHLLLGKRSADSEPQGKAPMKEYMDRVQDRQKWEDVSHSISI